MDLNKKNHEEHNKWSYIFLHGHNEAEKDTKNHVHAKVAENM